MLLNGVLVDDEFLGLFWLSPSGSLLIFSAAGSNPYDLKGSDLTGSSSTSRLALPLLFG